MARAAELELVAVALTDHDTLAGVADAQAEGERRRVRVVGGCEFSVEVSWGELHLLGYFLSRLDTEIEDFLARTRLERVARAHTMVAALHALGVPIEIADVDREAAGGAVGRPHVARALLEMGEVTSIQAAFDRYIGQGKPAYVPKELPPLADVARLVHRSGGVVSAAHLKWHGTRESLVELKEGGIDAVEVLHPSHDRQRVAKLNDLARELDLARTGGSDWHGEPQQVGTHAGLGSQRVPEEWLAALEARRPTPST